MEPHTDFGDDAENRIRFEFAEIPIPEYLPVPAPEYYQVWDESNVVLARSPSLAGANLPRTSAVADDLTFRDILQPDARPGRLASLSFAPAADGAVGSEMARPAHLTLAVCRSTEPLDEMLAMLLAGLSVSALATTAVMLLLVWATVRTAVAPLDDVCRELARVARRN